MSTPDLHITINNVGYAEKIFSQQGWAVYVQGSEDPVTVEGAKLLLAGERYGRITLQHFDVMWTDEGRLECTNEFQGREALRLSSIESVVVTELTLNVGVINDVAPPKQSAPAVKVHLASGRTVVQVFLGGDNWDAAYTLFNVIESLIAAN